MSEDGLVSVTGLAVNITSPTSAPSRQPSAAVVSPRAPPPLASGAGAGVDAGGDPAVAEGKDNHADVDLDADCGEQPSTDSATARCVAISFNWKFI